MKQCKTCNEGKSFSEYYVVGKYYNSECKSCHKIRSKKHTNTWKYKVKGVYGIFSGQSCLYVGESKQVNNRFTRHKHYIKNPEAKTRGNKELYYQLQKHNNLEFRILEETLNHKAQERIWIDYLNPLYNTY
tara:strand:- start:154 stop:546 length:393 start_codon:yes stop_codon:yes gene_type:complete